MCMFQTPLCTPFERAKVPSPNEHGSIAIEGLAAAVMAVVDGIGWKSRKADLRRIHDLWITNDIDGLYTVSTLDQFRADLQNAARLRGLI